MNGDRNNMNRGGNTMNGGIITADGDGNTVNEGEG